MAERRMFAKTIIDSDAFLDMPLSAQALYFHLSMRADDDGFINNPKKIQRMIGSSEDDFKLLVVNGLVLSFESGITVIKHWRIHNYIRADRYKPSIYTERELVTLDEHLVYQISDETDTNGIPTDSQSVYQTETQVRLGKDSVGKDSIGKDSEGKDSEGKDKDILSACADVRSQFDYQKVVNLFNSVCKSLPKIQKLTDSRKQKIRKADKELNGDFESFFMRVENSDFLSGKNGKWQASFDWILKPQNLIKIIEGNYDGSGKNTQQDSAGGYDEEF